MQDHYDFNVGKLKKSKGNIILSKINIFHYIYINKIIKMIKYDTKYIEKQIKIFIYINFYKYTYNKNTVNFFVKQYQKNMKNEKNKWGEAV